MYIACCKALGGGFAARRLAGRFLACFLVSAVLLGFFSGAALGQDISAQMTEDFGDVMVVKLAGSYDAHLDTASAALPRSALCREFYRHRPDSYDFIIVFTNFAFEMPKTLTDGVSESVQGFYSPVKNDTRGIGRELFDNTSFYGSAGRLQGMIDMGNLAGGQVHDPVSDPLDPDFTRTMTTLSHELLHRFAAYVRFMDNGSPSGALLGSQHIYGESEPVHWSYLLDTRGSLMYGNYWADNGDGSFTSLPGRKYYSPLDLYLMGLASKDEVPPMLLIENPEIDPARSTREGETISGAAKTVTIDDIIAAEGERVPDADSSQKEFRVAFVLATRDGAYSAKELYGLRQVIRNWRMWFSSLTDARARLRVDEKPPADLAQNPGVDAPEADPRQSPAAVMDAVTWLMENQLGDGSWEDAANTAQRDTAVALCTLSEFDEAEDSLLSGLGWLDSVSERNTDFLCRKILAFAKAGSDADALCDELVSRQNPDGGWGASRDYPSNSADSALALYALGMAGRAEASVAAPAVSWLTAGQNPDGGWDAGDGESKVQPTTDVIRAFCLFEAQYSLTSRIDAAAAWLVTRQNPDGGFGNSPSTVYDTARALAALSGRGPAQAVTDNGIKYLLALQDQDGSWFSSAFQTSLAVDVLGTFRESVDADLSVVAGDIVLSPGTVTAIPTTVSLSAVVKNLGLNDAGEVKVAFYDGEILPEKLLAERSVSIAGRSQATVSYTMTVNDGTGHRFIVAADPENALDEPDEDNNAAFADLANEVSLTPELSLDASGIGFDPAAVVTLPQQVTVSALVRNTGYQDATGLKVALYENAVAEANKLAETVVDVPSRGTATATMVISVGDASAHQYFVAADADNAFAESNEYNNTALSTLYSEPGYDLWLRDGDVSLSPASVELGQEAVVSVTVRNRGTRNAFALPVRIRAAAGGSLREIVTRLVDVPAGGSASFQVTWATDLSGDAVEITAFADPANAFLEMDEDNNQGAAELSVTLPARPDLSFAPGSLAMAPSPALEGQAATLSATLLNTGGAPATDVLVRFWWNASGNLLLGSASVASLDAGGSMALSVPVASMDITGLGSIVAEADPENAIEEINESDNTAVISAEVRGMPDLALSASSIVFSPAAPREGDALSILVTVQNAGSQDVANVGVDLLEDGLSIGQAVIPSIAGQGRETVSFSYATGGRAGAHQVRAVADAADIIDEKDEGNNAAERAFAIQDADLWVTEPIFSPNGDGSQDETGFFFRLDSARSLTVQVVAEDGTVVRSFSGPELADTTGGGIVWDGKDDRGVAVADGRYRILLRDENGRIISSLSVIVDNNRSALVDALGTEWLLTSNLTCMLPWRAPESGETTSTAEWFPDDSGFLTTWSDAYYAPEYPAGTYSLSADGKDVVKLDGDFTAWGVLSPDGAFVAFKARDDQNRDVIYKVDRNGRSTQSLYVCPDTGTRIDDFVWSPNSSQMAVLVHTGSPYLGTFAASLLLVEEDGTVAATYAEEAVPYVDMISFSPDASRLCFLSYDDYAGEYYVRAMDLAGNADTLYQNGEGVDELQWMEGARLLLRVEGDIWILDASPAHNHVQAATGLNRVRALSMSPTGERYALVEQNEDTRIWRVFMGDAGGTCSVIYQIQGVWWGDRPAVDFPARWSEDGGKLAFVDNMYEFVSEDEDEGTCLYNGYAVVYDVASGAMSAFPVSESVDMCHQAYSFHIETELGGQWGERGSLHFGSDYTTKSMDLYRALDWSEPEIRVRIRQEGLDAAHVDRAGLVVRGRLYRPVAATELSSGEDVLFRVAEKDNEVADAHEKTIELVFRDVPPGMAKLTINAREEDLSKRNAGPFHYPASGEYTLALSPAAPIIVDGLITEEDGLGAELFKEFSRPVTGHPSAWVFGYARTDGEKLYGVLDFTVDNTLDGGRDWAAMQVSTSAGAFSYTITDAMQQAGKTSFSYTSKVRYQHKVYEFAVPLADIGAQAGDVIRLSFSAYGTAGSGYDDGYAIMKYKDASLTWLNDNTHLLAQDEEGLFVINTATGLRSELISLPTFDLAYADDSPGGNYIGFARVVENDSVCYEHGFSDYWTLRSLLNLTAELKVQKEDWGITLYGIAADANLESYTLEYAPEEDPGSWSMVAPPSDIPVVNDVLGLWVPPAPGAYYVRLTVRDRAGNEKWDRKRVTWGLSPVVVNVSPDQGLISPNGDGVKDGVSISYTATQAATVRFEILDASGTIIRTLEAVHGQAEDGQVSWDGRDESANVVPDGDYAIRVNGFSMDIRVDATPPELDFALGQVEVMPMPPPSEDGEILAGFKGRVQDANLKSWIIEYGEGVNPAEWFDFYSATGEIFDADYPDALVPMPVLSGDDLGFCVGKTFRLTAEDHAGNRSVQAAEMLEEILLLTKLRIQEGAQAGSWYAIPLSRDDQGRFRTFAEFLMPGAYVQPGEHELLAFSSIRAELTAINLQYRVDGQWIDAEPAVPGIGQVDLAWDNSLVDPEKCDALRVRAVDEYGQEHYSFPVPILPLFSVYWEGKPVCSYSYKCLPYEELSLVRLQVRSSVDPLYPDWTDFKLFGTGQAEPIPVGTFELVTPFELSSQEPYEMRMQAVTEGGLTYISASVSHPNECGGSSSGGADSKLNVSYVPASECGEEAAFADLFLAWFSPTGLALAPGSLSYYVDEPAGERLIKAYDLSSQGIKPARLDVGEMPEGNYTVRAVLSWSDPGQGPITASETLVVDHTAPDSRITLPAAGSNVCRLSRESEGVAWEAVGVEGWTQDLSGTCTFNFSYGFGENPADWKQAYTGAGVSRAKLAGTGESFSGLWNVSGLPGGRYTLRLQAWDRVGNLSCYQTPFTLNDPMDVLVRAEEALLSSNGDGSFDSVGLRYTSDRACSVDIVVKQGESTVRSIVSGLAHPGGEGSATWDGRMDGGAYAPDGAYLICVQAVDSCGSVIEQCTGVEIDTQAPLAVISRPLAGTITDAVIQIRGTLSDANFASAVLTAVPAQGEPLVLAFNLGEITDGALAAWNTEGLSGDWSLQLSAADKAGNTSEASVAVTLGSPAGLISQLSAEPGFISPNWDGVNDSLLISYTLDADCDVNIEIFGEGPAPVYTASAAGQAPGQYEASWDGRSSGAAVADGEYEVRVTATLSSDQSVSQAESLIFVVDATPPAIAMALPQPYQCHPGAVTVSGSVTDANLERYRISYEVDGQVKVLDEGVQPRQDYDFGILADLAEGEYSLSVTAVDRAGNPASLNIPFSVDRSDPVPALTAPEEGELFGFGRESVEIRGGITEQNLAGWELAYASAGNPGQWTGLVYASTLPGSQELFSWNVGPGAGIADGAYLLRLRAEDCAGRSAEASIGIVVDNTAPTAVISSPAEGAYVTGTVSLTGSAWDENLDSYTVDAASGDCSAAFQYSPVKSSPDSVQDGTLASWTPAAEGPVCLRLSVTDELGNKGTAKAGVIVDLTPPAAPALTGEIFNGTGARLSWAPVADAGLAGYNVYRDGARRNSSLVTDLGYEDPGLLTGTYAYVVTAVDRAGWESEPSAGLSLTVDLTGPDAKIASPADGSSRSDVVSVKGTAFSADDFKEYRVQVAPDDPDPIWLSIRTCPLATAFGELALWDSLGSPDGAYRIRLSAEDIYGNVTQDEVLVNIDNTPPAAPVILSAVHDDAGNVDVAWQANAEPDLAGYLLFANGVLANVDADVAGDLSPYLIDATGYHDEDLADGTYEYWVSAMDEAGNESEESARISVTIDRRAPAAVITQPEAGILFDTPILVQAECPDLDVASVQFQVLPPSGGAWLNLGAAVTSPPWLKALDPEAELAGFGTYQLRAVATDEGGQSDSAPASISVVYGDSTPPPAPGDLAGHSDGTLITLSWSASPAGDLAGYNIYLLVNGSWEKKNTDPETVLSFAPEGPDEGLFPEGEYEFAVTGVDNSGNESLKDSRVAVTVWKPWLAVEQPFIPTAEVLVAGGNARPGASVAILCIHDEDEDSLGTFLADEQGEFSGLVTLYPGANSLRARSTDAAGNVSLDSDSAPAIYALPPTPPTGLAASPSGYDVSLSWDTHTDADVVGTYLYRDGMLLNPVEEKTDGTASASENTYYAYAAFDRNEWTYWESVPAAEFAPLTWRLDLNGRTFIRNLTLAWKETEEGDLYAGRDYEIQADFGFGWLTLATVTGNAAAVNSFAFDPPAAALYLRIVITDTTSPDAEKSVRLCEVSVTEEAPFGETGYQDGDLSDGTYLYQVQAVNRFGVRSELSAPVAAAVGDVTPPAAPQGLSASVNGADVSLAWTANSESDLDFYQVYRTSGGAWILVTPYPLMLNSFQDTGLANAGYTYTVTALDLAGNESPPSAPASALVGVELPGAPENLSLSSSPEGDRVNLAWSYSGTAQGFVVYRSETPGGPYEPIAQVPGSQTTFVDEDVVSGVTYYYVVAAEDAYGNQGEATDEAYETPLDQIPPGSPVILQPTVSGAPYTSSEDRVDISGTTEEGVNVLLLRDGVQVARQAAVTASGAMLEIPVGTEVASLSPDYAWLDTWRYAGGLFELWRKNLASGEESLITANGFGSLWSPDGTRTAFSYRAGSGAYQLAVYDHASRSVVPLTESPDTGQRFPSFSSDGALLAYLEYDEDYRIYLLNLSTWQKTLVATLSSYVYNPALSPDGTRIAYSLWMDTGMSTYLVDLAGGQTSLVTEQGGLMQNSWSPDGTRLALMNYGDTQASLLILDLSTLSLQEIDATENPGNLVAWSPDGTEIFFDHEIYVEGEDDDWNFYEVWRARAVAGGEKSRLAQGEGYVDLLSVNGKGRLAYLVNEILYMEPGGGSFLFTDAALSPGENLFTAVAEDPAGNRSQPSEPVSIILDPALFPDLVVADPDIAIVPVSPLEGEDALIRVSVRNEGSAAANGVDVDIYLWDAAGALALAHTESIDSLGPQEERLVSFSWDTAGKAGRNTVFAVLDEDDEIVEADEDNNLAVRDFLVASGEGVFLGISLDATEYGPGESLEADLGLVNSGPDITDASLVVRIEDQEGNLVAEILSQALDIPYGFSQSFGPSWEAARILAGSYRVKAELSSGGEILAEAAADFTITGDASLASRFFTDQSSYAMGESVILSARVENQGRNQTIESVSVEFAVVDASGAQIFAETQEAGSLWAGSSVGLDATWEPGNAQPGAYTAIARVSADGSLAAVHEKAFSILADISFDGSVSAHPSLVAWGGFAKAQYSLSNLGNADASGVSLTVLLLDPVDRSVLDSRQESADLVMGETRTGSFVFDTQILGLETYEMAFTASYGAEVRNLGAALFSVADRTPPVVKIRTPQAESGHCDRFLVSAAAADLLSGLDRVEYRREGVDTWQPLPLADPATGTYAAFFESYPSDAGAYTLWVRATDRAGNTSEPRGVSVFLTPPLDLLAGGLSVFPAGSEASCTYTLTNACMAQDLVLKIAVQDAVDAVVHELSFNASVGAEGTLSGTAAFSTAGLPEGIYRVRLRAENLLGGAGKDLAEADLVLADLEPPLLSLVSPLEGAVVFGPFQLAVVATDADSGLDRVEAAVDAEGWMALPLLDAATGLYGLTRTPLPGEEGDHTARFRAFDLEGNVSAVLIAGYSYVRPFTALTGVLDASPDPVGSGLDEVLSYVVTDESGLGISDLVITVTVNNPDTGEVLKTFSETRNLTAGGILADSFVLATRGMVPRAYRAVLSVAESPGGPSRELASDGFILRPGLRAGKSVTDPIHVLVWVNDPCDFTCPPNKHGVCNRPRFYECYRTDLLGAILAQAADDYLLVYEQEDFEREVRNPYHTDVLILGEARPIGASAGAELRERIYSGTGVIASVAKKHRPFMGPYCQGWHKSSVFGVTWQGQLQTETLKTEESPVTGDGVLPVEGKSEKILADAECIIAGWLPKKSWIRGFGGSQEFPGIVLNEYGRGRTVYMAFDLGLSLSSAGAEEFAPLIIEALRWVHSPADTNVFAPNQVVNLRINAESDAMLELLLTEVFERPLMLRTPGTGDLVLASPWISGVALSEAMPLTLDFAYVTPGSAGTYATRSDLSLPADLQGENLAVLPLDIDVQGSARDLAVGAIAALEALYPPQDQLTKVRKAIARLEDVRDRAEDSREAIEESIQDLLEAAYLLLWLDETQAGHIRLMIDDALVIEQGAWYYWVAPEQYVSGELHVAPDPVEKGGAALFSWTLENRGFRPVPGATISVLVIFADGSRKTYPLPGSFELGLAQAASGDGSVDTGDWPVGYHAAELVVEAPAFAEALTVARVGFGVAAKPLAPVADAGGPYIAVTGETLSLDGSGSFDPNQGASETGLPPFDSITAWDWEFDMAAPFDYSEATGETVDLPAFAESGVYQVALRVTDNSSEAFPSSGPDNLAGEDLAQVIVYEQGVDDFRADATGRFVRLGWRGEKNAAYTILRSEKGPNKGFTELYTWTRAYYNDRAASRGKTYWYRIRMEKSGETWLSRPEEAVY